MPNSTSQRYLVLSDMHFGTPESSINQDRFRASLITHMASKAPWDEIIFTGDLFDINLSTFTRAIEGGKYNDIDKPLVGFRQFLDELHRSMLVQGSARSLKDLAKAWIYIPGNHDYKIWDMLATKIVCEDVLAGGGPMGSIPTPLMKYSWHGVQSFLAGIFRPFALQNQVVVDYSFHAVTLGPKQEKAIFTHGHYLDRLQTRGPEISDQLNATMQPEQIKKNRRQLFIRTAQYQTAANAISFTKDARALANLLFGPSSIINWLRARLIRPLFPTVCRGEPIAPKQLDNIDAYLKYFCEIEPLPRWFVFGHTHYQDKAERHNLKVYNAGSCYVDRGMPITFLQIEAPSDQEPQFQLMCIDQNGTVHPSL